MPRTTTIEAFVAGIAVHKGSGQALALISALPAETVREKINKEILLANYFVNQPGESKKHIHNALHLALPHGHRQLFLAQTDEVKNSILDFASDHPNVFAEALAAAIRITFTEQNKKGVGLENPLTKRELDILRRLPTGLPITQIAVTLHISNNTIKTHLKNVYKKLGVDSRDSAVAKGKELLLF
jgi:DNA-binding NarL/FixJ family response regulator